MAKDLPDFSGGSPPVRALTQADTLKKLMGEPAEPQHLSGIKRKDAPPRLYRSNPEQWPRDDQGRLIPQVNWAGLSMPLARSNLHFLIAGVPGTGKTVAFQSLCDSIFHPQIRSVIGGKDRAIVYDPKQEFVSILSGMSLPEDEFAILNPFDRRSFCWNLAADYTDPASAIQLAKSIIPVGENLSQPFFAKASAALLAAVITEHIRINPGNWDLADVIFDCLSEDLLLQRLTNAPKTPYNIVALSSLSKGDTRASVIAELSTALCEFLPIAACWRKAREQGRSLSIRKFLTLPSGIIVLGANRQYSETLSCLNRLFLRRFSEFSLDSIDDSLWQSGNRTWLFLDELKELGKVHDLATVIAKGRSKGICAVLGFQDISGLEEAFGEKNAQDLTACCHHRLFLKLNGKSAEWASTGIGETEIMDTSVSVRSGHSITAGYNASNTRTDGMSDVYVGPLNTRLGSKNWSESKQSGTSFSTTLSGDVTVTRQSKVKSAVLDSELSGLPDFAAGRGVTGFACEYSGDGKVSVVSKVHIPAEHFAALWTRPRSAAGFEPWRPGELEW